MDRTSLRNRISPWSKTGHSVYIVSTIVNIGVCSFCRISAFHFILRRHHANMPMNLYCNCYGCKIDIFQMKYYYIFHISDHNMNCGYTLEPPH